MPSHGSKASLPDSCRRSSCLRFQMFGVETFSFLPECQRDGRDLPCEREACHIRLHSLGQQSCVKVLQWSRATTGAHGRTLEDLLHLVVVILIQTADLLWLFGTLQLAIHITMLRAVVRLHRQATVGPQLPFAAKPVGRLHQGETAWLAAGRSTEPGAIFLRPGVSGSRLKVLRARCAAQPTVHPSVGTSTLPGGVHRVA